jgi:nitroreductase
MLEAIRKRSSIRKYKDEPVTEEQIETLLRAGMQAPSARNLQPWEFITTRNRELMRKISDVHPYAGMVPSAGAVILVLGNTNTQPEIGYILEDCSASIENILLEAVNMGLGAVWLGVYPREERVRGISKLFVIPDHIVPVALVSIGVPNEEKPFIDRYDPAKVHRDRWQS